MEMFSAGDIVTLKEKDTDYGYGPGKKFEVVESNESFTTTKIIDDDKYFFVTKTEKFTLTK